MSIYEKRRQQMERDRAKAEYKNAGKRDKGQQKGLSGGGLAGKTASIQGKTKIKKKTNPYRLGDY